MSNPAYVALRLWLAKHDGDIAHGIKDFAELAPVFKQLMGHLPRKETVPETIVE